jgi:hypothetical protein
MPAKLVAKTAVKSDDGKIYWIDTIEHEGGLWLVPKWLATTYPQMYKPARMIQMDTLAHNLVDYDFQRVARHDSLSAVATDILPRRTRKWGCIEDGQRIVPHSCTERPHSLPKPPTEGGHRHT